MTCLLAIDLANRETVRETGAIVQVSRVDEQEIYALFVGNLLHVDDKRRKVPKISRIVGLRLGGLGVAKKPS
jgi:hypothetical protein